VKSNLEHIRDALNGMRKSFYFLASKSLRDADERREAILKCLVKTDPSPNHNRACDLHEEHTGRWLISSLEYKDWINGSTSPLWLHGIPGAGKTVLLSFIIESVKNYCKTDAPEGTACIYYYCYFGRKQDETPHLLRWVINQLCRQSKYISDEVQELYRNGDEPAVKSLMAAFATLCRFRRVYLLVDALDEPPDRQNLLDMLIDIAKINPPKLQILVASRKEVDIQNSLQNIFKDISLSNPRVDEDIRNYIHNQLRDSRKFGHWPEALKAETETALVIGAEGMYVP
jgi:NACHT domain